MSLLNALVRASSRRSISTSALRRGGHHAEHQAIGGNLPFDISNRYKLTAYFMVFFGSGFGLPFFLIRHHLKK